MNSLHTNNANIILGIDPGIERTGFGVIDASTNKLKLIDQGCITTSSKQTASERLLDIEQDLQEIIEMHKPNGLAIEQLFFSKNVTSALVVGQARGVILLTCARAGLEIFEYNPMQIKVAMTGHGGADKEQMEKMVQKLLKLDFMPTPDDVSDALAIAICHAHNQSFISAVAKK